MVLLLFVALYSRYRLPRMATGNKPPLPSRMQLLRILA